MKAPQLKLLNERYFLKKEVAWVDTAKRVSVVEPSIEQHIIDMEFIPSSPTLFNLNTAGEREGTLSSCFIVDVEDSMDSIMDTARDIAVITKASGGVGCDFSSLRSSHETVKSIGNRKSSGPLPFIDIYNSILDGVQQGGARRGAGMALLSLKHGNILDFINAKNTKGKFERFNFSIKIPNSFYELLETNPDTTWMVEEVKTKQEIPLTDNNGREVSVKQLWDLIVEKAWSSAEPGIFNEDIAYERCTVTNVIKKVGSNPCAEYVNIPYSSCNLGSINLSKFINEDNTFNYEKFEIVIRKATRYLDAIIDNNKFPLKKIKDITLQIRPIGLGYMGLAHALYMLRIPYNSKKGLDFVRNINRSITLIAMDESCNMAKEKGSYPAYDKDLFFMANRRFLDIGEAEVLIDKSKLVQKIKKYGVRNSCFTSIAPTGSISFLADTSSGVEPVFALSYERKIEKLNKQYEYVYIADPVFEDYLNKNYDEEIKLKILKHVAENKGSCQQCEQIPLQDRIVFVVSADIDPTSHLDTLEIACSETSLSVSKTLNLPKEATREAISNIYLEAYKRGIIGVTVYRDGCREGILVYGNSTQNERPETFINHHAPKRPKELNCELFYTNYKGEKWISFVGLLENKPFEIFCGKYDEEINLSKEIKNGIIKKIGSSHYSFIHENETLIDNINKSFHNEDNDDFARMVSLSLRSGNYLQHIVDTLNKAKGDITKFSKILARILKNYLKDGIESSMKCEKCNEKLIYTDGCLKCSNPECGFSKCG